MRKELEITPLTTDSFSRPSNKSSEYLQLCDNVTSSNLEPIYTLLSKIEDLYYKSVNTHKTSINSLEDIHINPSNIIFLLKTLKLSENGVIIKKIKIPTTHRNIPQEPSSDSNEFTESSLNSMEDSDLEDEILSQHKLEAHEQSVPNPSALFNLFKK